MRGAVKVGSIGSGDFDLKGAGGDAQIGSIGSGKSDAEEIGGNLGGGRSKGSGSIKYRRVDGTVEIPQRR